MPKILITGATGFIGSHLVKFFTKNKYQIIAQGSSAQSINRLKQSLETDSFDLENIEFWNQNFLDKHHQLPPY